MWTREESDNYRVGTSLIRSYFVGVWFFGDPSNLVFTFYPLPLILYLWQFDLRKELRCAVILSIYNYMCTTISGEDNIWTDLHIPCTSQLVLRRLVITKPLRSGDVEKCFHSVTKLLNCTKIIRHIHPRSLFNTTVFCALPLVQIGFRIINYACTIACLLFRIPYRQDTGSSKLLKTHFEQISLQDVNCGR